MYQFSHTLDLEVHKMSTDPDDARISTAFSCTKCTCFTNTC